MDTTNHWDVGGDLEVWNKATMIIVAKTVLVDHNPALCWPRPKIIKLDDAKGYRSISPPNSKFTFEQCIILIASVAQHKQKFSWWVLESLSLLFLSFNVQTKEHDFLCFSLFVRMIQLPVP